MARRHGVTAETYERLVIDAGEVRLGFTDMSSLGTLLGATRGGNTFVVEQEIKDMPVDGAKGPVKGGRRITKVTAKLTLNMIEWTTDIIKLALPGASEADYPAITPTHDLITRALAIALTDYQDNVALIGEVSGTTDPVVVTISNALGTGNFELAMSDNEEGVCKLELTAHFDPDSLDAEPWAVYYPQEVNPTTEGA